MTTKKTTAAWWLKLKLLTVENILASAVTLQSHEPQMSSNLNAHSGKANKFGVGRSKLKENFEKLPKRVRKMYSLFSVHCKVILHPLSLHL